MKLQSLFIKKDLRLRKKEMLLPGFMSMQQHWVVLIPLSDAQAGIDRVVKSIPCYQFFRLPLLCGNRD